jgi:hypothetical protein
MRQQTIIFIRDKNFKGQEISGYIDYAHRLKTEVTLQSAAREREPTARAQGENFTAYFAGTKKLLPKPSDLSYYNWETQT